MENCELEVFEDDLDLILDLNEVVVIKPETTFCGLTPTQFFGLFYTVIEVPKIKAKTDDERFNEYYYNMAKDQEDLMTLNDFVMTSEINELIIITTCLLLKHTVGKLGLVANEASKPGILT